MTTSSHKKSTDFWTWLSANSARVQAGLKKESTRIANEVGEQFEKSYPGLVWEVSPADKGPWLFCVSANGDRKLFPRVQGAVADAPPIAGWKVQAFRPRGDLDAEISMNGQTLSGDDIWCEVEPKKRGVSLVLHLRGVTEETEELLSQMALILLDNAIGEFDSVMKVAEMDLALLEDEPEKSDHFFPLRDLPAYLDRLDNA